MTTFMFAISCTGAPGGADHPLRRRPGSHFDTREGDFRHLLTHTSGLAHDTWDADLMRWYGATGAPDCSTGRTTALATPLVFDPGTRWEYAIGIDWAGQMVAAVTGQTFSSLRPRACPSPTRAASDCSSTSRPRSTTRSTDRRQR